LGCNYVPCLPSSGGFLYIFSYELPSQRKKNSKKMFLILYRKKNNNIYKSSTGLCNVCIVHDFHPRCAWLFFLFQLFGASLLSNIEQHYLAVTLKKLQVGFACWKKKKPKMLIIFVWFLIFRERKSIKVFFDVSVIFFFLAHVSREEKKKTLFHCFFLLYIVYGGGGG